ncbi:MAG: hypothetical protein K0S47_1949 [Herbinix sp.]|jgi:TPR repeat protein|nr:hypothetical protein [Herbinix sp.]
MDELLKKYGISEHSEFQMIKKELEKIQRDKLNTLSEIQLQSNEDKDDTYRVELLQKELQQIEDAIESITWSIKLFNSGLNNYKTDGKEPVDNKQPDDHELKASEMKTSVCDVVSAYEAMRRAAEQDDEKSQYQLGRMHYSGEGALKSKTEAIYWFTKAATKGSLDSQLMLGRMYELGDGVDQNEVKSRYWYEKAASQGDVENQYKVGCSFLNKNDSSAIHWLLKAAEQGHQKAIEFVIEQCYAQEYINIVNNNLELFLKAAEQGNSKAQYLLGRERTLYKGTSERNTSEALEWFMKASGSEEVKAMFSLGMMLCLGDNVKQDIEKGIYWLEKAANKGNAEACYHLGKLYYKGDVVNKEYEKAVKYFMMADHNSMLDSEGYLCSIYYERKEYLKAFNQCNKLIEHGKYSLEVIKILGDLYYYGHETKQDYSEAFRCFKNASEEGYLEVNYKLGEMYWSGLGVKQDFTSAYKCYHKLENLNDSNQGVVYERLGDMSYFGLGTTENIDEALRYYSKAEELAMNSVSLKLNFIRSNSGKAVTEYQCEQQGTKEVINWITFAAESDCIKASIILGSVYKNRHVEREAKKWYQKAADLGNADALFILGMMYEKNYVYEESNKIASDYYQKAANQNNAKAMYHLGKLYEKGYGVKEDLEQAKKLYSSASDGNIAIASTKLGDFYYKDKKYVQAIKYFLKAVMQGDTKPQFQIGEMYLRGEGVTSDLAEAIKWFNQASEHGDTEAQKRLADIYEDKYGTYNTKDIKKAIEFLKMSAIGGNKYAQHDLAEKYYYGTGVERDYVEAIKWFTAAAEKYDYNAMVHLGDLYLKDRLSFISREDAAHWYKGACVYTDEKFKYGITVVYDMSSEKSITKCYVDEALRGYNERVAYRRIAQQTFKYLYDFDNEYTSKDIGIRVKELELNAENGKIEAQRITAAIYLFGYNVKQDINKAVYWFSKAAVKEDTSSIMQLAYLYESITPPDYRNAAKWYEEAVKLGEPKGLKVPEIHIAECYEKVGDLDKAFQWFLRASKEGVITIQLAEYYRKGNGTKRDYGKATEIYRKLIEKQSDKEAYRELGLMYYEGLGVQKNYKEAAELLELGKLDEDPEVLYVLGDIYISGKEMKKDYRKASDYFRKAAQKGMLKAKSRIMGMKLLHVYEE